MYCLVIACLSMISGDMLSTRLISGFYCYSGSHDRASDVYYWLAFVPLSFAIPYLYVFWVFFDVIFRSNLLPARGKRRDLSVYFFRISFVFLFMWMPAIVMVFMVRGRAHPWAVWAVGTWSHLQGLVSASIACLKPDIAESVNKFVTCQQCRDNGQEDSQTDSRGQGSSFFQLYVTRSSGGAVKRSEEASDNEDIPEQDQSFQFVDEARNETSADETSSHHLRGITEFSSSAFLGNKDCEKEIGNTSNKVQTEQDEDLI
jgi:hypothetical protein